MFSAAARCKDCGGRFWGHFSGSGTYRYRRLEHRPGGCSGGHHETRLSAAFAAFMADWKLPNDAKARIARYVSAQGVEESVLHRRKQLGAEIARLADLYRWDHLERVAYLRERSELEKKLAALPAVPTAPPDDGMALIDKIGEV